MPVRDGIRKLPERAVVRGVVVVLLGIRDPGGIRRVEQIPVDAAPLREGVALFHIGAHLAEGVAPGHVNEIRDLSRKVGHDGCVRRHQFLVVGRLVVPLKREGGVRPYHPARIGVEAGGYRRYEGEKQDQNRQPCQYCA